MANKKISALTSATTPLAGTETLPVVQSGATVKATIANIVGAGTSPGSFTTVAATGDATITKVNPTVLLQGTEASAKTVALIEAAGVFKIGQSGVADWATFSSSSLSLAGGLSTAGTIASGGTVSVPAVSQYRLDTAANYFLITQTASGTGGSLKISQDSVRDMLFIASSGVVTMPAYGAGAATFSAAGVISSVSDENWKIKDGVPSNPTEMLNKLEPGYWYYNEEKRDAFGAERQLGFYAQNVNAAIGPEAAPPPESYMAPNEEGVETLQQKPWGYYDRSVLAVVVMALQEALATVKALEVRIQALENKL